MKTLNDAKWQVFDTWDGAYDSVEDDTLLHGRRPDQDYLYDHYDVIEGDTKILIGYKKWF